MTTIEQNLVRLRADLRAAVHRDLRRRARRRWLARVVAIPVFVLASASAAVAIVPTLGDPAPEQLKAQLDRDRALMRANTPPGVADHIESPDGDRLSLVARGQYQLLYGSVEPSGAWCAVEVALGGSPHGWSCQRAAVAGRPDEVVFFSLGGGSTPEANAVSGHVGNSEAREVRVSVPGEAKPVVAEVGRLGFFIAQLPNAMLRSQKPPLLTAEALDAGGHVVARSRAE